MRVGGVWTTGYIRLLTLFWSLQSFRGEGWALKSQHSPLTSGDGTCMPALSLFSSLNSHSDEELIPFCYVAVPQRINPIMIIERSAHNSAALERVAS